MQRVVVAGLLPEPLHAVVIDAAQRQDVRLVTLHVGIDGLADQPTEAFHLVWAAACKLHTHVHDVLSALPHVVLGSLVVLTLFLVDDDVRNGRVVLFHGWHLESRGLDAPASERHQRFVGRDCGVDDFVEFHLHFSFDDDCISSIVLL